MNKGVRLKQNCFYRVMDKDSVSTVQLLFCPETEIAHGDVVCFVSNITKSTDEVTWYNVTKNKFVTDSGNPNFWASKLYNDIIWKKI